jgi:hypothetical protein
MSYKDMSKVRDPVAYMRKSSKAVVSQRFIQIVANDPHLDYNLSRLLALFATPMPRTTGGYAHHDGLES